MSVIKQTLVKYSTDTSGSVSFSLEDEQNVAIRYFVRDSSKKTADAGSVSTAKVNVYGTITGFESDRGSIITGGDPDAGRAATDALFIFSEDSHTSSLKHFTRITVAWSDLTASSDISIVISKF
tara:strand:- start:124 stop:495 length:372 start_codon:yes stop_codon:yes gene_type:complete